MHIKTKNLSITEQHVLKKAISNIFEDSYTEHITIDLQAYTTYMEELFKDYQQRLNVLDEETRKLALRYAEDIYRNEKCTKEEALERGITKAEMELKNL